MEPQANNSVDQGAAQQPKSYHELILENFLSCGIALPDDSDRERYGPRDWSPGQEAYYKRMIAQEFLSRNTVPRHSWIFPSPFIAYVAGHDEDADDVCWGPQPRTLAELRMYSLSWAIRSKPEWQRKVADPAIMDKWRKEALAQQESLPIEEKLTANMVNNVLTELAAYNRLSDPETGIESGPFDAIWYSDRLISDEISDNLRTAIVPLEDVPDELKDWHPGSNGQVLDLVHPSLYPVIYHRTRFSKITGSALLRAPQYTGTEHFSPHTLSEKFSWLPSDFSVDATNGSVKLLSSYINNLHPKHGSLYRLVESALSSFVPLFECVLSQVNGQDKDLYHHVTPGFGRIKPQRTNGYWPDRRKFCGISVPCVWKNCEQPYPMEMLDHPPSNEEYQEFIRAHPKILPEAYEEYTGELENTIAPYSLRGKTIQCIIKLANIHLTPENPKYKGGSWHVEGMINERIVASGIYYYEEDNISEARLAFRVTTSPPVYHNQDDELCMEILYGMERNRHCCQDLGSIATKAGRALAWPNIYQHRVSPFHLLDPSKPGHRKILAVFLVDPSIEPIPSATTVPPQQREWVAGALDEAQNDPASALWRLPPELTNIIFECVCDGTDLISRDEAEEYRLSLMEERTASFEGHDAEKEHMWNMCEH
ncbi:hypothetical protein DFH07DRAFT_157452 [Mycena maculata]|uniref:Uncharacterized protein n=1 Tax=Mycena maculata TaxID=230809 RepID=A0AAD7HYE3_9AGAR|nr:hypothetical protein DFH07DRAFT_157452 [Mycena maculata]